MDDSRKRYRSFLDACIFLIILLRFSIMDKPQKVVEDDGT